MMNTDVTSQMYMLMGLTQMSSNSANGEFSYFKTLLPIMFMFGPFFMRIFNLIYEWVEELIYYDGTDKVVSIKFPVHEIRVHKDSYKSDASTRQLYSINYMAINDYIRDNLGKINGISNMVEILNVNMDYYSDDTNERNFILIPSDSSEILIEPENKIYCKIISTEKKSDDSGDNNNGQNIKSIHINDKVKTYELIIFCKADNNTKEITDEEKKNKMEILNKFIDECVKKYNDKNEEKYEGKHWIYEYYHSYKDEYAGLELKFKEYLFENNKDLDTNIFFEGKDKLIKYVDKFIYNEEEVENKVVNKYEQEYKTIGYTYKATFLLYGFPGCGKTSTIKAILNRTKRHGIIINWSKIKTCEELETIFRNRLINHKEYDARELCFIIEDCDASKNNILLSRKNKDGVDDDTKSTDSFDVVDKEISSDNELVDNKNRNEFDNKEDIEDTNDVDCDYIEEQLKQELQKSFGKGKKVNKKDKLFSIEQILKKMGKSSSYNIDLSKYNDNDAINLSCLLNILDGLIELHGVMVIFTTNHPEKLDEAFTRPGRIDFKQEFKRANIDTIKSIINTKFKLNNLIGFEFPSSQFVDYVLSPAEIQSICFQTDDIQECIEELLKEQEKNMSRFDKVKK
jgi:hypothetical protein